MSWADTDLGEQYFRVEVYDEANTATDLDDRWVDITRHVIRVDKMQDSGTGDIPAVILFLNCIDGQFITERNVVSGNATTPILDQFMLFRTTVEDNAGDSFSRITFLDNIQPQRATVGLTANVTTYGREKWLKDVKITGHYYFERMQTVVYNIINTYNNNKGSKQPKIIPNINIPSYPVGIFDFGAETNCYDALMQVISRLNQPVSAGGAGDYYELVFYDNADNPLDCIDCHIFPLARTAAVPPGADEPASLPVIRAVDIDTDSMTETKENISATVVVAQGAADTGSFPENIAQLTYKREEFVNLPVWTANVEYPRGTYVRDPDSKDVYVAQFDPPTTQALSTSAWKMVGEADFVDGRLNPDETQGTTPKFVYSPWTEGQAERVYPTIDGQKIIVDSNLVIKDGHNYRNWADVRIKNLTALDTNYLYNGTGSVISRLPEDFRILVDSNASGNIGSDFAGTDSGFGYDQFGISYRNALVQFRNGRFIVIREPNELDEIAVFDEGDVFVYDKDIGTDANPRAARSSSGYTASTTYQWRSIAHQWLGTDCFHTPSENPSNVAGLAMPVGDGQNSSIHVRYSFTEDDDNASLFSALSSIFFNIFGLVGEAIESALDFFTTSAAYRYGWWGTLFHAPFPQYKVETMEDGTMEVGSLYKNGTIDLYNLNHTRSDNTVGQASYTHDNGQDLGQLTGISFLFRFDYTINLPLGAGLFQIPFTANLPFRVFMYDTEDNVWVTDINYRFLGDTQLFTIPFSSFRIYRARNPVSLSPGDVIYNILNPELKVLEIFETRRVKHIGIQWQQPYDEEGRFNPANTGTYFTHLAANIVGANITMTGYIDAFHFTKAPIVIERAGTGVLQNNYHIMENIKQYPNVSNVEQLRRIARADADLAAFRMDNFTVTTTGKCDIRAGQAVYLNDIDILDDVITVQELGLDVDYQRTKLAVRKVNYTINTGSGPAGFKRTLTLARRINP